MTNYFNFAPIIPPNPNDPVVNVATQLDANWDEADRVMSVQQGLSAVVNPEYGLEMVDLAAGQLKFYDGAAFQSITNFNTAWSAWSAIDCLAPIVPKSGFTPRWRNNSLLRLVQIAGRVQNGVVPASFGTTTYQISADTGNGIPSTMKPFGGSVIYNNAASAAIAPSATSATYLTVVANSGTNNVKISGRFTGTSDGTSHMTLDGVQWWY